MDPTLWRNVDAGSAVLFFVIVFSIPLLVMMFNPSPHAESDYVDDRQGLGEIDDEWGLTGLSR